MSEDLKEVLTAILGLLKQQQQPAPSIRSNVPSFQAFDKAKHRWDVFLCQLNQHFEAYNVLDTNQKRAYFLSWIGTETYELLQKLFGCNDVSEQKYETLIDALTEHFKSKTHVLAARYSFYQTKMKDGQSYVDWVADLRGIARDCLFTCDSKGCDQPYVDSLIRDVLILHTPHDRVRSAALQKINPTLEEVLSIAAAYEATQNAVKVIKGDSNVIPTDVYQTSKIRSNNIQHKKREHLGKGDRNKSCRDCNVSHKREDCKWRNAVCHKCKKSGHISSVCLSTTYKSRYKENNGYTHHKVQCSTLYNVQSTEFTSMVNGQTSIQTNDNDHKVFISLIINEQPMRFQLDTGATCSMVGLRGYRQLGSPQCKPVKQLLNAYGNTRIPIKGIVEVSVKLDSETKLLNLLVTDTEFGNNLFGMDWFSEFDFAINRVPSGSVAYTVSPAETNSRLKLVESLCEQHKTIFEPGLGTCKMFKAHLQLKPGAQPKFFKPRPVPFARMQAVKEEVERLSAAGVWKSINSSSWAAPIVVVPKPTGVRICGDFKVTVNSQIDVDQYPIPRIEELFHKLQSGQRFSKIDLADAYLQIELDEESKTFMVVNTPFGLFQYQRLAFGVSSAPAIFQRFMDQLVAGLPGCATYLDDIIITGQTDDEHLKNLNELLTRLEENGLRCKLSKCKFFESNVEYLGHIISADGISPSDKGIQAIKNLPRPQNLQELQSFLGKVNYYSKFIDGFTKLCTPLNFLRRKFVQFKWSSQQEDAFQSLKHKIVEATRLVHFRDDLPLILASDASSYGIGAVILHRYPDGTERPIAHASKTLDEHQRRYSQIEKEALSIIYGVKKFHQYLYGRKFELVTDHKPLITIFHPEKQLPVMTAHRLQRWAITLMAYNYSIRFKPTAQHGNADALSRLPVGPDRDFDQMEEICNNVTQEIENDLTNFPIDSKKIALFSKQDNILRKVFQYMSVGWPEKLATDEVHLCPYFYRRFSITTQKGVLLMQAEYSRVIVPKRLQHKVLHMLHEGHWGIVRMKQLARRYCWWPNIDKEIEKLVSNCSCCQVNSSNPTREFKEWPKSQEPWERIHIDYAGPFWDSMWLICVDSSSKFPYVARMSSTTSATTIQALRCIFTIEGLPNAIVSDNGPQFSSKEFQNFCQSNGISHVRTAPFHPASNGEAERFVRTFKVAMEKSRHEGESKEDALQKFLCTYRASPNSLTGKSPAELLHGRQPKILLSLMKPNQQKHIDCFQSPRKFNVNDLVIVRNFARGSKWIDGTILKCLGRITYLVKTNNGIVKRHQNQLKRRVLEKETEEQFHEPEWPANDLQNTPSQHSREECISGSNVSDEQHVETPINVEDSILENNEPNINNQLGSTTEHNLQPIRRSTRIRRPVDRYSPNDGCDRHLPNLVGRK